MLEDRSHRDRNVKFRSMVDDNNPVNDTSLPSHMGGDIRLYNKRSRSYAELNRRTRNRYGHDVQFDQYTFSSVFKVTCFIIALIIIPVEIVIRKYLRPYEIDMILGLQESISSDAIIQFFIVWVNIGEVYITMALAYFFYLYGDSLLGFKVSITTLFGILCISILKIFYKVPRPFWIDNRVQGRYCLHDFAGPSDHIFEITFFYPYCVFMYLSKYAKVQKNNLIVACFIGIAVIDGVCMLGMVTLGCSFLS